MIRLLSLAIALAAVVLSAVVRVETALGDPRFDAEDPAGMLKSDPALLHHITERVRAGDELLPDELRSDLRIQHPDETDILIEFTVGQELLIAWSHRVLGIEEPLHLWAVRLMALSAALVILGAWGLVLESTRDAWLAASAALLTAVLPACYRTIGFVYLREDLSFPLFALHLWALARAARTQGIIPGLAAGSFLALALTTWHAMPFFVVLESGVLFVCSFFARERWIAPRTLGAIVSGSIAVGLLGVFLPRALFGAGLAVAFAGLIALPGAVRMNRRAASLALPSFALVAGLVLAFAARGSGVDLGHVIDVVLAKLNEGGRIPLDPQAVPFDARLLWQGPFRTLAVGEGIELLGLSLIGLPVLLASLLRPRDEKGGAIAILAFTILSLFVAWLIERTVILPALLLPAGLAIGAAGISRSPGRRWFVAAVVLLQAPLFASWLNAHELGWYGSPERCLEERALFDWIQKTVPRDEAILTDFVTGPSVLAFAHRPICLQPKYETDRARRKIEELVTTFHRGTWEELRELARKRFQARWILVDVESMWMAEMTWLAGLPLDARRTIPGTAAELLLGSDPRMGPDESRLRSLPGARVAWRSPPEKRPWSAQPISRFLLLELG